MNIYESTRSIKFFIHSLGIDIVGIADLSELRDIPVGLNINLADFFKKYPSAIVLGAQYGKISESASGDETAVYLEKIAYDVMGFLEERQCQFDDHPNSREEVIDVQSCLGDEGCMVCILKCPYLKKNRTQVRCAHNGNDGMAPL